MKQNMVNQPVTVVLNEKGAKITLFENNPERGFIMLESATIELNGGHVNRKKRTSIINGEVNDLKALLKALGSENWPGRIAVLEYTEDTVPENYRKKFVYEKDGFITSEEEGMEKYLKRSSKDGVILTKEGRKIVKFNIYDPTGSVEDIRVAHDNVDEVMAERALRSAKLPE